ncbi:hypothetical protein E4U15_003089 [Claviceps sp. LM218 group G6]|nr:hypothetical protein E4U15_003089 [Claviceps sp. LM218 group G6]
MDNIETKPPADLSAEYQRGSAIADHRTEPQKLSGVCAKRRGEEATVPAVQGILGRSLRL